ncbi:hypothetical protein GEMRC1_010039 [Eukaryota sp. GEM-RC1]
MNNNVTKLIYLLDESSPCFLPRLRCIDFTTKSQAQLITFCKALLLRTTIIELCITVDFTATVVIALTELFRSVHSFTSIKLLSLSSNFGLPINDEHSLLLFNAFMSNTSLKSLDLSGVFILNSSVLDPLLHTSSLKSLVFPCCRRSLDSRVIDALKHNGCLQELTVVGAKINAEVLSEVLEFNTSLKKLELIEGNSKHFINFLESSCSQRSLKRCQTSSCHCEAKPFSHIFTPDHVSDITSSFLACEYRSDSRHIHFQQTLIVLVSSHLVRSLWKSHVTHYRYSRSVKNILLTFLQKVGYVSKRFVQSAFLGVQLFFDSSTIVTSASDLSLIFPITSYFKADLQFWFLEIDSPFNLGNLLDHTSRITGLQVNDDVTNLTHLLDSSSPLFLRRLRCLEFTIKSQAQLITFCRALLLSTTIIELSIAVDLTATVVISLTEVFRIVHSFRKIILLPLSSHFQHSLTDEQSLLLFTSLMSNTSLKSLKLSGIVIESSRVLVPLLNTSSLRSLVFPSCRRSLDSTVIDAFKNNNSLHELTIIDTKINVKDLSTVLKSNTSLKKLVINECFFKHIARFLESN